MAQPSPGYSATIKVIDKITVWTGYLFMTLLIPLIFANVIEVFQRYVMGAPTIWAAEVTTFSFGALFMLGCAYALLKGAHVRTDMLWDGFSIRTKGLIDSITYLVLFLPSMAVLTWISWNELLYAISIDERSNVGSWQPIIWPLRAAVPIAFGGLFLQAISEFLKSFWAARTGEELVHHEKIEI